MHSLRAYGTVKYMYTVLEALRLLKKTVCASKILGKVLLHNSCLCFHVGTVCSERFKRFFTSRLSVDC